MGNLYDYLNEDSDPLRSGDWTRWTSLPSFTRPRIPFGSFMFTDPTNDDFYCSQAFAVDPISYTHCKFGHTGVDLPPCGTDLELIPAMSHWMSAYAEGNWIGEGLVKMMERVDNGGWNGGYGQYCVLSHCNPALGFMVETAYCHLRNVAEPPPPVYTYQYGRRVAQGGWLLDDEPIAHLCQGTANACGWSTATHLHFELRVVVADDYEVEERCYTNRKSGRTHCNYRGRAYYSNPLTGVMHTDCDHYVNPYSPGPYVSSFLSGQPCGLGTKADTCP